MKLKSSIYNWEFLFGFFLVFFPTKRGTEEMIKRAPSMDLQLATILRLNSSNMSIDRAGLDEGYDEASK